MDIDVRVNVSIHFKAVYLVIELGYVEIKHSQLKVENVYFNVCICNKHKFNYIWPCKVVVKPRGVRSDHT